MAVTFKHVILLFIGWCIFMILVHWQLTRISDFRLKAVLMRVQLVFAMESALGVVSFILWKTLGPLPQALLQTQKSTINSPRSRCKSGLEKKSNGDISYQFKENKLNQGCLEKLRNLTFWHYGLLAVFAMGHFSYCTNLFLIGVEPHWFSMLCYSCLGLQIQCMTGLVLITCFTFLLKFAKRTASSSPTVYHNDSEYSDTFLSRKKRAVILIFYVVFSSMTGLYTASQPPKVKHVAIPVRDLPENLKGLRIVQLSDIHLGPTVGYSKLKMIFNVVEQEKPDILVITGDMIDGTVAALRGAADPLTSVNPKYGKLFVSGNHEYYTGDVDNWFEFMSSLNFNVLHNSNVKIPQKASSDEHQICFAGTDDLQADTFRYGPNHKFDVKKAVQGCDVNLPVILLAHQPTAAKKALDTGVRLDLILSGHTHAGQMFPFMFLGYLINPFFAGLYKIEGRDSHVYVSAGTQYWGIPMRIGTNMEVTSITLHQL